MKPLPESRRGAAARAILFVLVVAGSTALVVARMRARDVFSDLNARFHDVQATADALEGQGRYGEARALYRGFYYDVVRDDPSILVEGGEASSRGARALEAVRRLEGKEIAEASDSRAAEAALHAEAAEFDERVDTIREEAYVEELARRLPAIADPWVRLETIDTELRRPGRRARVRAFLEERRAACRTEMAPWEDRIEKLREKLVEGESGSVREALAAAERDGSPQTFRKLLSESLVAVADIEGALAGRDDLYERLEVLERELERGPGPEPYLRRYLLREQEDCKSTIAAWERRGAGVAARVGEGKIAAARSSFDALVASGGPEALVSPLREVLQQAEGLEKQMGVLADPWAVKDLLAVYKHNRGVAPALADYVRRAARDNDRDLSAWVERLSAVSGALDRGVVEQAGSELDRLRQAGLPRSQVGVWSGVLDEARRFDQSLRDILDPFEARTWVDEQIATAATALRPFMRARAGAVEREIERWEGELDGIHEILSRGGVEDARAALRAARAASMPEALAGRLAEDCDWLEQAIGALAAVSYPYAGLERLGQLARSPRGRDGFGRRFLDQRRGPLKAAVERWETLTEDLKRSIEQKDWLAAQVPMWSLIEQSAPEEMIRREKDRMPQLPWMEGLSWVWIPPGRYFVGTAPWVQDRGADEINPTEVRVVAGYWMASTEIPQAVYSRFDSQKTWDVGGNQATVRPDLPAHSTTFDEALAFCRWLETRIPEFEFSLPNEVEWEVAARGCPKDADLYPFAVEAEKLRTRLKEKGRSSSEALLARYAVFDDNRQRGLSPCGTKAPNPLGLLDMQGNVHEWCLPSKPYETESPKLGDRLLRGGSYLSRYEGCRASSRAWQPGDKATVGIGFRVIARLK